jgi:HlyD family secretion protein
MIQRIIPIVILLLVAAGVGGYLYKTRNQKFYFAGTIEATKVDVPARLATIIANVKAGEGDRVEAGQTLFELECADLKIQQDVAATSFDRGQRLARAGSMPQETFDQLRAKRDEIALKLSWCQVPAPTAGTVLTTFHEPGEWVAPGMKLMTIADLSNVWAYVYVAQPLLVKLQPGMAVSGFLPELAMREIKGSVVKINDEAEFTPKNVQTREERTRLVYGVKIKFQNTEGLLKPGMPIEVDLPDTPHG